MTSFLCVESKLIVCGPKLTCLQRDEYLNYLLCGWWLSKLTWFWYAGRKSFGFSVSIEIDLVFVWGVDIDLISE